MFRKQVYLLPLFGALLLLFSSCSEDTKMAERAIQGRIDSAVRSRLDEERLRLETRNDSLIVQEARQRADSLHAAGEMPY